MRDRYLDRFGVEQIDSMITQLGETGAFEIPADARALWDMQSLVRRWMPPSTAGFRNFNCKLGWYEYRLTLSRVDPIEDVGAVIAALQVEREKALAVGPQVWLTFLHDEITGVWATASAAWRHAEALLDELSLEHQWVGPDCDNSYCIEVYPEEVRS